MRTKLLACSLTIQSLALLLTLITKGLTNNIFFTIFWISTIISLVNTLNMKKWDIEEWFGFAAITFSMVGGVLYAIRALKNELTIIILITILLFMAGIAQQRKHCILKGKRSGMCCGKKHKKEKLPQVIIVEDVAEIPVKKSNATKKKANKKTITEKKVATKKAVKKKAPVKKKVTKKKVTKKKTNNTTKVSVKAKKATALSHGKYHKPKLPNTKKKTSSSKK